MQIKLQSGATIELREMFSENAYILAIRYENGREVTVKMNPDELKWFALDVHKKSSKLI